MHAYRREEPPTKTLVCIVSKDENMRGMRVPWGAGIVGHVGLTLKSLNIPSNSPSDHTPMSFDQFPDHMAL